MRLIDQLQRDCATMATRAGSHKPGYRITDAQQHDPSVYKTYDDDIETAGRSRRAAASWPARSDLCTIDGAPVI